MCKSLNLECFIGWFARDPSILCRVGHVLLQLKTVEPRRIRRILFADDLFQLSKVPMPKFVYIISKAVEKLSGCKFLSCAPHFFSRSKHSAIIILDFWISFKVLIDMIFHWLCLIWVILQISLQSILILVSILLQMYQALKGFRSNHLTARMEYLLWKLSLLQCFRCKGDLNNTIWNGYLFYSRSI